MFYPFDLSDGTPVIVNMQRLFWQTGEGDDNTPTDPRTLPAMRIDVQDFAFNAWQFGALTMALDPVTAHHDAAPAEALVGTIGTNRMALGPTTAFAFVTNWRSEPWIDPGLVLITTLKLKPKSAAAEPAGMSAR